jgi:hypothetical protein
MKAITFLFAAAFLSVAHGADRFPSWSENHKPPDGFPNPFTLSQEYPEQPVAMDQKYPWDEINFKTEPEKYMTAVLTYALAGNDINLVKPPVDWYHAPWLHADCRGREYVHGLTMERTAPRQSLHPNQTDPVDNWAVGLYNRTGAYTVGQVWKGNEPDPKKADFPRGSVGVKFLFTTATAKEVPFLDGAPRVTANIFPTTNMDPCRQPTEPARVNREMRLLQVDIAVRDTSAENPTGWVFGTFIYSAAAEPKKRPYRLVPVGLMWSNDQDVKDRARDEGAFENSKLKGGWINKELLKPSADPRAAFVTHFGLGGRVNGPVDNPISSCLSCHASAARPTLPMTPSGVNRPSEYPVETHFDRFFTDIAPGPIQEGNRTRLDYSLQLSVGIRNFYADRIARMRGKAALRARAVLEELGPEISREGTP